jgi:hypothetical protein
VTTTLAYSGLLVVVTCPVCGIGHAIPQDLNTQAKRHRTGVHCPLGHTWIYTKSVEQDLAEAKRDAEYYKRRLSGEREDHGRTRRRLSATQGVVTRTKKRIAAGVCPCCKRTFQQLARHMAGQHPDYAAEPLP